MFFSILVFVFVTGVTMTMTRNALALALACRSETWMESMTRANISARWVAMVLTRVLHHCCSDGLHQSTTYTIVAMVFIAAIQTVRYTEHSTTVLVKRGPLPSLPHSAIVQQSRTSNSCVLS